MRHAKWIWYSTVVLAAAIILTGCAAPKAASRPELATPGTAVALTPTTASGQPGTPSAGGISTATPSTAGACALETACSGPTSAASGSFNKLKSSELASMLKAKDFQLINVHTPYAGEIEGTDVLLPYDQIEQNLGKLPADKSAKIVLYCRSGAMSTIAAGTLVKLGYSNVWNLDGGMGAWQAAGYPLVNKNR